MLRDDAFTLLPERHKLAGILLHFKLCTAMYLLACINTNLGAPGTLLCPLFPASLGRFLNCEQLPSRTRLMRDGGLATSVLSCPGLF